MFYYYYFLFYPQSAFYPWSAVCIFLPVCSLRFTLTDHLVKSFIHWHSPVKVYCKFAILQSAFRVMFQSQRQCFCSNFHGCFLLKLTTKAWEARSECVPVVERTLFCSKVKVSFSSLLERLRSFKISLAFL